MPIARRITAAVLFATLMLGATGCVSLEQRLSGYTCEQPACVIDPRGVPVEPCCHCAPMSPGCGDTNARSQFRWMRQAFFDSMYAWIGECNYWPNSDCCDTCN